jgi:hypothetical protein
MKLVKEVYHGKPGGNLPARVREATATRGYGDAIESMMLVVIDEDIETAFCAAAQGNGSACVMAQAGTRIGAEWVYFYRGTAWVDYGTGPIVRYKTGESVFKNVIRPFDHGDRPNVTPGFYPLKAPKGSTSLAGMRKYQKNWHERHKYPRDTQGTKKVTVHKHTERMVMASEAPK